MAIAALNKAELVAPRDAVPDLLRSLEQAALLHVDDVHDGLPKSWRSGNNGNPPTPLR